MMQVVDAAVFAGAFGMSAATIAGAVAPQWRRIVAVLAGEELAACNGQAFAPLRHLVRAERRIAVRRWAASGPVPRQWRAAA